MITETTIKNAQKFCSEDISHIKNYNEALNSPQKYCCHHINGLTVSRNKLKQMGLYFNRPSNELIFISLSEHSKLHNEGRNFSDETIQKMSEAKKGRTLSDETKRKQSESMKGKNKGKTFSETHKQNLSEALKGNTCHKGKPTSDETKKKLRNANGTKCTINNITYNSLNEAYKTIKPDCCLSTFIKRYNNK